MKQSIFKIIISYFAEQHIETIHSDHNEVLHLLFKNGRYQLCTTNAIYSYGDKYDNFRDSYCQIDLDRPKIKNVLLLGFGLGSIPFMLERNFKKHYTYTGVEIDESIIYLASKYVLDDLVSEIEMVQADAYAYILQTNFKYDLICIDIFIDDKIPEVFLQENFLKDVSKILSNQGFIMFNHLAHHKIDKKAASDYFEKVFRKVFPESICLEVRGNHMLISEKNRIKT